MANRTPAPAMGTMGTSPASLNIDTQGTKARKSAALCYVLAVLVMIVTGWFVIEGVQSTEPASSARHAKVAAGVLLLVLEMCAFSLAGAWRELSPVLRALGWSIFVLQIVLMSLAQIAVGTTAAKSASLSTATIEEIRAQADASRQAAKSLMADADKMRTSKNAWVRQQAGEKSTAAAQQTAAGADAVAQLQQLQAVSTSTPVLEMIGKPGLIALSISLSLILELAGITLMHCAGTLRRRADGALPVDVQILELLHRVHGVPTAAPHRMAMQAVAPAGQAPAPATSYRPAGTVAPAGVPTGVSYGGRVMLAGAGALAAAAPVAVHAHAPAVPAAPVIADRPGPVIVDTPAPANEGAPAALDAGALASSGPVIVATPAPVIADRPEAPAKARKARVARDSSVMDSGTGPLDGFRYRRAVAGVKAGKIKPSIAGLYEGVEATAPTARRFLAAMADAGVIMPKGRGWTLAGKGIAQ